jgi:hypothetical protein
MKERKNDFFGVFWCFLVFFGDFCDSGKIPKNAKNVKKSCFCGIFGVFEGFCENLMVFEIVREKKVDLIFDF